MPEPGQHDLVAVRQVGEELLRRDLRRGGEVERAADQQRLTFDVRTRLYSSSSGVGRPGIGQPAAAPDEAGAGSPRIESRCRRRTRSTRARRRRRRAAAAASWPQTNGFGNAMSPSSDWSQNPLASPSSADSHESSVIGAEIGAASEVVSISP